MADDALESNERMRADAARKAQLHEEELAQRTRDWHALEAELRDMLAAEVGGRLAEHQKLLANEAELVQARLALGLWALVEPSCVVMRRDATR